MRTKAMLFMLTVGLLAACGGSSDGSAVNPTQSFTTVKQFANGGGVAKGVRSDGARSVLIAPEIADVVLAANSATQDAINGIEISDFPIVQQLGTNANIRQGALTIRGIVVNVTIFEDQGGNSQIVLQEIPTYGSTLMATGTPLGTTPNGSFTYNGTFGSGSGSLDPQVGLGSFSLSANFNAGTFTFNGSTVSDTLAGGGFIDVTNGSLASNNMNLTTSGSPRTASMYGNFHGDSAQGVSGIFHSNEASPVFSGAFVGSR